MRWTDLDAYGHVNNAAMLTLLEEARIAAFWSDGSSSDGSSSDGPTAAIGSAATKVLSGGPASDTRTLVARQEIEYLRSEEHTSELQSRGHLVCRLLLEKKKLITTDV